MKNLRTKDFLIELFQCNAGMQDICTVDRAEYVVESMQPIGYLPKYNDSVSAKDAALMLLLVIGINNKAVASMQALAQEYCRNLEGNPESSLYLLTKVFSNFDIANGLEGFAVSVNGLDVELIHGKSLSKMGGLEVFEAPGIYDGFYCSPIKKLVIFSKQSVSAIMTILHGPAWVEYLNANTVRLSKKKGERGFKIQNL